MLHAASFGCWLCPFVCLHVAGLMSCHPGGESIAFDLLWDVRGQDWLRLISGGKLVLALWIMQCTLFCFVYASEVCRGLPIYLKGARRNRCDGLVRIGALRSSERWRAHSRSSATRLDVNSQIRETSCRGSMRVQPFVKTARA